MFIRGCCRDAVVLLLAGAAIAPLVSVRIVIHPKIEPIVQS